MALLERKIYAQNSYGNASIIYYEKIEKRNKLPTFSGIFLLSILILNYLWLSPLTRRIVDMEKSSGVSTHRDRKASSPAIIRREALASYSTADELRKWLDLRQQGAITEAEYQDARAKILNQ
jgi:hypothetical protein